MTGTSEGGKKAAESCGKESLAETGRKGGENSHDGKNSNNNNNQNRSSSEIGKSNEKEDNRGKQGGSSSKE